MSTTPRDDVATIAAAWQRRMDLRTLTSAQLIDLDNELVDLVAIGKAAREMATAATDILGKRVVRSLIVCDAQSTGVVPTDSELLVGEHPVPAAGSLRAGQHLVRFLRADSDATATLFLISGGASSLCAYPAPPLSLDDLEAVWGAALATGANITTLNQLRAATSLIAGGAVVSYVRTPRSVSVIMVDNVISGAPWVASALTYDYRPNLDEMYSLIENVGLSGSPSGERLLEAFAKRRADVTENTIVRHENRVLAEPAALLEFAFDAAKELGYAIVNLGDRIHGDVELVASEWRRIVDGKISSDEPFCVVGVGEVTVRVRGAGTGGRCQQFALSMSDVVAENSRPWAFAACASDGRDFLTGVAGGLVDQDTTTRARAIGLDIARALDTNDSHPVLSALGQILPGGHTGWNLCDVYVACVGARPSQAQAASTISSRPEIIKNSPTTARR